MLKLIKYEFRKTMFSKFVVMSITALSQLVLFAGIFFSWDKGISLGFPLLTMCSILGILYIGIDSLLTLHRDLNTKQSYMLFLTPKSSFQILGAKVLENGLSIFLMGAFFLAVSMLDISVAIVWLDGFAGLWKSIKTLVGSVYTTLSAVDVSATVFALLATWLLALVIGYLSIVLSATVFAGKRLSAVVSFFLYILITTGSIWLIDKIPLKVTPENLTLYNAVMIGITLLFAFVMYLIASWIMERKLNV